jgi:predicted dithiol-disulfide oxidoreductase (DUF899 family)
VAGGADEVLEQEKELTRRSDELARQRRELPWVTVEKENTFETNEGTTALAEPKTTRTVVTLADAPAPGACDSGPTSCFDGTAVRSAET